MLWEVNPDGNQGPRLGPDLRGLEARGADLRIAWPRIATSTSRSRAHGDPQNVPGVRATPELFNVLKSNAALGRTFTADEAVVGADRVVVLSHGFWTRALGARCVSHRTRHPTRLRALHRRRRDAAGVRVPDQHRRGSVDAAGVRSEGHARPIAARAIADGGRAARRGRHRWPAGAGRMSACSRRAIAASPSRQQRRMGRARRGGAGTTSRRVAAGADGADGRRGIPAADRLRQHGQPAAGAALEPSPRDGGARRARREPLGSGAAGDRREPAARRSPAACSALPAPSLDCGCSATLPEARAAADGTDPARRRRAAFSPR